MEVLLKLILPVHRIRRWRYNLSSAESKFKTPMIDHQDKYMMKAQVHMSKSSVISDVQPLPRRKHYCQIYQVVKHMLRGRLLTSFQDHEHEGGVTRSQDERAKFDESNANVLERFYTSARNPVKENLLKLNLSDHKSILTDLKVTLSKHGRITKPYSSSRYIANYFNAGYLKMEVKEIGKSSGIDNEVVQYQRQRNDNDLQDERQDQPKEEEELVDLLSGCKPLGYKWIFKKKMKANGTIDKYKARLAIKGFRQQENLYYFDTYSTRITPIKMILAITTLRNGEVYQMDVKITFLNGDLGKVLYMNQPEGFMALGLESKVYRLVKSLYGLRKAPK
nr:retrotransposon protein putative Ty1-copia subclass [Tanacetum cinerariifolium]